MSAESLRRGQIMKFVEEFVEDNGYPPTVREIQKGCGISSTAVVQHHLNVLEREGQIRREREISRSIVAAGSSSSSIEVPLLGTIAAGQPIPVPTEDTWGNAAQDSIRVPREFVGSHDQVYALRVKGSSMIDALVDDGDLIVLEPVSTVHDGQMVAAWYKKENEATLKKFYMEKGKVRLQPANSQMDPIYVDPRDIEIQGRVVGVIRRLN